MIKRLFTLIMLIFTMPLFAKTISLEWKEIDGAIHYEFKLEKDGKVISTNKVKNSKWEGDCEYGVYTWSVRAIDEVGRPGIWSEDKPLLVMPPESELISPKNGTLKALFSEKAVILMKWKPVPAASYYKIHIKKDNILFLEHKVSGEVYEFIEPEIATYSWSVTPVFKLTITREIASTKVWEGKPTEYYEFKTERKILKKPTPLYPPTKVSGGEQKKVKLKWTEVDGADQYLVKVRSIASAEEKEINVESNQIEIDVENYEKYRWEVAALGNVDNKGIAGAIGPKSISQFTVDPRTSYPDRWGQLSISYLAAPYSYSIKSAVENYEGSSDSRTTSIRLSGDYYFNDNLGFGAILQNNNYKLDGTQHDTHDISATALYRLALNETNSPIYLYPRVGFAIRNYFEILPNSITTTYNSVTGNATRSVQTLKKKRVETIGPKLGFDLKKQVINRIFLSFKFDIQAPMNILSGDDYETIGGIAANAKNYNLGFQGDYWIRKNFSVALGMFYEKKYLEYFRSYLTPGSSLRSTSAYPEKIQIDSFYFYGSIIYTLGK